MFEKALRCILLKIGSLNKNIIKTAAKNYLKRFSDTGVSIMIKAKTCNLIICVTEIIINALFQFGIVLLLSVNSAGFFAVAVRIVFFVLYILAGFILNLKNKYYNFWKSVSLFVLISFFISLIDIVIRGIQEDISFIYAYAGGIFSYIYLQYIENEFLVVLSRIGISMAIAILFNLFYLVILIKNKRRQGNSKTK